MTQQLLRSAILLGIIATNSPAIADTPPQVFSGPFYQCPDAHGDAQKALFRLLDLSNMQMRVEGMGQIAVQGIDARVVESQVATEAANPIGDAFTSLEKLSKSLSIDRDSRVVAICFATQPPPKEDIDGPFHFLPGFFANPENLQPGLDAVLVPAQTYLVLDYVGPVSDVGNMRFTLTEDFWPKIAPSLGLVRKDGPNVMIFKSGDAFARSGNVEVEMWTPIEPPTIKRP